MEQTLSDICKEKAVSLGLCNQWQQEWEDNSSKEVLIEKYLRGIDFCMKHNYPSVDFIKEKFGDTINAFGIYVDTDALIVNKHMTVLLGNSNARVSMQGVVGEIYVRHQTNMSLVATNYAKVWVNALDFTKVRIYCDKTSKVFVHNYGDAEIETRGENISVKEQKGFFGKSIKR